MLAKRTGYQNLQMEEKPQKILKIKTTYLKIQGRLALKQ